MVTEVLVGGTLKPDGTIELDQMPTLSPGRVEVVLRRGVAPLALQEDWFDHLLRIRAEREASGYPFMSEAEANAHLDWLREEDRIDDLLREADEQRRRSGPP